MHTSNRHIKLTIIMSILAVLILGCSTANKIADNNYQILEIPPNGVKIADNFFCDKTEVANIGWREYMLWTKRIFGRNSAEYIAILPDSLVWRQNFYCLESFTVYYLNHPTFIEYPVVGITKQQAIDFSKWRSDRYFEILLLLMNKIEFDSTQNRGNYFTIEKYFKGTYGKILPGEKVKYYPNFRLPTISERKYILNYADSLDQAYFKKCNSKYCKDCKTNFPKFYSDIVPCNKDTLKAEPTISTKVNYSAKKGHPIFNLRGNVSEWSSEENITFGGGWLDKREKILTTDTFHVDKQNSWTGFRNVCEWKQWKEY